MVSTANNTRGASRLGCLVSLLFLAAIVYFGLPIGIDFFDEGRLKQEMKANARLATNLSDEDITRRLQTTIRDLELPDEGLRIRITRATRPREIIIQTEWTVIWEVPFYQRAYVFRPEVRSPI